MTAFGDLHRPGRPLVLANVWDVGSARAMVAAGFPAVGTTSLGVAASHGLPDAARAARDQTLACAAALMRARLGCFVTCDIEDGFSDDPAEVADLVHRLGVDGVNLEDDTFGRLIPAAAQVAKIRAVKALVPDVFVNARTDVFWLGDGTLGDAIERAKQYVDAGADGVFLPGRLDAGTIAAFVKAVDAPVNVLASATLSARDLADLGVARISTGSLPYRAALRQAVLAATAVRDGDRLPEAMGYDEVQALHS
jgi:2-methylisocitrate lyase-like PEP mutase family enzyme